MATISVKRYFSYDVGAPTMNGTAGSAITVLDALLVNGYNAKSIQSITRSGATATVAFATAHGYTSDQVVALSGMDQAEYNGEFRPFNVTATSFDITVTGTPVSPATGASMSAKVAPLNWSKVFGGTNKAVYKSNYSVVGCLYLRVDDTGATNALCRGYETMTDVDTGTGPFPTVAQSTNGMALPKASAAGSTAASWRAFGDEALFYFLGGGSANGVNPAWSFNGYNGFSFWFGEPILSKSGDGYGTCIFGGNGTGSSGIESSTGTLYQARSYTQSGASISVNRYVQLYSPGLGTSLLSGGLTNPQPDGSFILSGRWLLYEGTTIIRGILPGVYHCPHSPSSVSDKQVLTDFPDLPGHSLFITATFSGGVVFDITGPWR